MLCGEGGRVSDQRIEILEQVSRDTAAQFDALDSRMHDVEEKLARLLEAVSRATERETRELSQSESSPAEIR